MDKIINFIIEYKFAITVIILAALILLIYVAKFTNNKEGMEVASLSKFVNKEINLKYKRMGPNGEETYYLAIAPRGICTNLDELSKDECINNVVILQTNPDSYSRMLLSFNPYGTPKRYSIMSTAKDVQPPYPQLTQNLNYIGSNKLCFDDSTHDDVIRFDIEENDQGRYRIKYRKELDDRKGEYTYFYIGECANSSSICNKSGTEYKRLCIHSDVSQAIYFDIEFAPNEAPIIKPNIVQEEKFQENFKERFDQMEVQDRDMYSLGSILSNGNSIGTQGTMDSIEGYDGGMNFGSAIIY